MATSKGKHGSSVSKEQLSLMFPDAHNWALKYTLIHICENKTEGHAFKIFIRLHASNISPTRHLSFVASSLVRPLRRCTIQLHQTGKRT
jgi:hypothetical protein